ncbi:hypothetical protein L1987_02868 [Smallanthus sonchifolius]|uniref:Uncharacterized protein n=1 Tax=Smallanthus sonchifolius TaxID=185202 RepID=A0ACB9K957_9ASTR|nr:hypothetical protein L1987_02868 [Smallanthus sonchifolius]
MDWLQVSCTKHWSLLSHTGTRSFRTCTQPLCRLKSITKFLRLRLKCCTKHQIKLHSEMIPLTTPCHKVNI